MKNLSAAEKNELDNLNMSPGEWAIFEVLRKGGTLSLDDIQEAIGSPSRHALIVRIKYLSAKVAPIGWIITKESGVGRGAKAHYSMTKKF